MQVLLREMHESPQAFPLEQILQQEEWYFGVSFLAGMEIDGRSSVSPPCLISSESTFPDSKSGERARFDKCLILSEWPVFCARA